MKIKATGILPVRATPGAAAFDLHANERIILSPLDRALINTGLSIELPPGYVGMVCPRSGLALRHGITVLNAPGIIDPDYRGEIGVILINLSNFSFEINLGDRIAQLLICRLVEEVEFERGYLSSTERSTGGFGSTGK